MLVPKIGRLVFLVLLIVSGAGEPRVGHSGSPTSVHDRNAAAIDVAYGFLESIGAADGPVVDPTHNPQGEVIRESFNPTTGKTVECKLDDVVMRVSLTTGLVVSAVFPQHSPRSMSVVREDGQPVSEMEMKEDLVKCSQEEALESAVTYVRRGYGDRVFEHLNLNRGLLVFRGSFFVYNFSWIEKTDHEGVAMGFRRLAVNVNPESCVVADSIYTESVPQQQPILTAALAKEVFLASHAGKHGRSISRICLLELLQEDGPKILAWAISHEGHSTDATDGMSIERATMTSFVNDATRGVYSSVRDLLDVYQNAN
jgi:hypothetical protein